MSLKKSAFNFFHIISTDGVNLYVNPHIMAMHYELFRQIIEKSSADDQPLKPLHGTAYEWAAAMRYALECSADGHDEYDDSDPPDRIDEPLLVYINEYQEVMNTHPEIPVYQMVIFSDYIGYRTELMVRDLRKEIAMDRSILQKIDWTELPKQYMKILYEHCGRIDISIYHKKAHDQTSSAFDQDYESESDSDSESDDKKIVKVTMHHDALQVLKTIEPTIALDMMLQFVLA